MASPCVHQTHGLFFYYTMEYYSKMSNFHSPWIEIFKLKYSNSHTYRKIQN